MKRDNLINTIATIDRAICLFRWLHQSTQKRQFDDAYLADFNHSAELDWSADSLMGLLKEISKAMPKQIASATLAELINGDEAIRCDVERLVSDFSFFRTTYEIDGIERVSNSIKINNLIQPLDGDSEAIKELKRWTQKVWSDASAIIINFETILSIAEDVKQINILTDEVWREVSALADAVKAMEKKGNEEWNQPQHANAIKSLIKKDKKVKRNKIETMQSIFDYFANNSINIPDAKSFCEYFDFVSDGYYNKTLNRWRDNN